MKKERDDENKFQSGLTKALIQEALMAILQQISRQNCKLPLFVLLSKTNLFAP
jgi:hypothetical protein